MGNPQPSPSCRLLSNLFALNLQMDAVHRLNGGGLITYMGIGLRYSQAHVKACPKGKGVSTLETWGVVLFVGRRLYKRLSGMSTVCFARAGSSESTSKRFTVLGPGRSESQ